MKYLFTFIFCCCSYFTFAEGISVKGVVTDMDSKEPIREASLLVKFFPGYEFSDLTDSLGQYSIITTAIIPEGYYNVEIEAKGYYKLNGFIHVTKENTFNFSLKRKETKTLTPIVKLDSIKSEPEKVAVLEGYATNNLVFLLDISASMNTPDRMPLLKESMKYLVNELRPTDRVTILTFSNFTKEIMPSTPALDKNAINTTIDNLAFGSTTNGSTALDAAYKSAIKSFIQNGNNRIVLASDGMFTSGEKEYKKLQQAIEAGYKKGISLSIFCFGKTTDYVKTKLENMTNSGRGNFANITTLDEGKQHMMDEAKAVKE